MGSWASATIQNFIEKHVAERLKTTTSFFHYTRWDGAQGILTGKCIRASDGFYMNDSRETKVAFDLLLQVLPKLQERYSSEYSDLLLRMLEIAQSVDNEHCFNRDFPPRSYLISLTSKRDDLNQWRAYGGTCGFCLHFPAQVIREIMDSGEMWLLPCLYDSTLQEQVIEEIVTSFLETQNPDISDFFSMISTIGPALKHESFQDEQEWRLITWRKQVPDGFQASEFMIKPFINIGLPCDKRPDSFGVAELMIGPGPHQRLNLAAAQLFLATQGLSKTHVSLSEVPYRVV